MGKAVDVLWVGQPDKRFSDTRRLRVLELSFDPSADQFGATETLDGDCRRVVLHPRWEEIEADFCQQSANRCFTDELLNSRPDAVVIDALNGASMDMARVGALLGYRVALRVPQLTLPAVGSKAWRWFNDALTLASAVYASSSVEHDAEFARVFPQHAERVFAGVDEALAAMAGDGGPRSNEAAVSGYARYAFGMRDHGLLYRMQQPLAEHFKACRNVLELACGTGVFLDILGQQGIPARGVERDKVSVRYARGLGLEVDEADALEYLTEAPERFDGIYCSHFVEHLGIAEVERLVRLVALALQPGGVAVFVFPDPESIRSQLLGFWQDPEHVRFYHPDLIELICRGVGLVSEFHSHRDGRRKIVPFSFEPPLPEIRQGAADFTTAEPVLQPRGWVERILSRVGLVHTDAIRRLEAGFDSRLAAEREIRHRLEARLESFESALRQLWMVNQTWAWDDNAVIRVRKPY